ncbi:hypothetical protein [Pseudovibrio ascidiaceicola]|uniref:hypothetical protein n=1 Tax=Pseudovibrio ascidiaceicola TaxID=285279 RepID=UPI000D69384C|nr:hypothetical protein [Pseudovibrio ascidiaceicola]
MDVTSTSSSVAGASNIIPNSDITKVSKEPANGAFRSVESTEQLRKPAEDQLRPSQSHKQSFPSKANGTTESQTVKSRIEERREAKRELVKDLIDLIETGHGGSRALMAGAFERTTEKLNVLMIKIEESPALKDVVKTGKGFKSAPDGLINVLSRRDNMHSFLKAHTARDMYSENFCLQSMISDLKAWTGKVIDSQKHSFDKGTAADLHQRLEASTDVGAAEYAKNPASRAPETPEEAVQYLHYAVGLFGNDKEAWTDYAKEPLQDTFPSIQKLSFERAQAVFERKSAAGDYG